MSRKKKSEATPEAVVEETPVAPAPVEAPKDAQPCACHAGLSENLRQAVEKIEEYARTRNIAALRGAEIGIRREIVSAT